MIIYTNNKHRPKKKGKKNKTRRSGSMKKRLEELQYSSNFSSSYDYSHQRGASTLKTQSLSEYKGSCTVKKQRKYENEEMQEREKKAQQEIMYKKTCTAPAYNKGPYMYIYNKEEAKDAGKKS